jgi:hypothetical protein
MNIYGENSNSELSNGGEIDGDLKIVGNLELQDINVLGTLTATEPVFIDPIFVGEIKVADALIDLAINNPADNFNLGFLENYTSGGLKQAGIVRSKDDKKQYILEGTTTIAPSTNITSLPRGSLVLAGLECSAATVGAYTLPTTSGTSGQVLTTDGLGNSDWETITNPFDQNLNTTDDATFTKTTIKKESATDHPVLKLERARGTPGYPLTVEDGDLLGSILTSGRNIAGVNENASSINCVASEDFLIGANGSGLVLSTTDIGSTAPSQKLLLDSNGVTINSSTDSFTLPLDRGYNSQVLTQSATGQTGWVNTSNPFNQDLDTTDDVRFNRVEFLSLGYALWEVKTVDSYWVVSTFNLGMRFEFGNFAANYYAKVNDTGSTQGFRLNTFASRGPLDARTGVFSNDVLASKQVFGFDGTTDRLGTSIISKALQTFTSSTAASDMTFLTCPLNSVTATRNLNLGPAGVTSFSPLIVDDDSGSSKITVNRSLAISKDSVITHSLAGVDAYKVGQLAGSDDYVIRNVNTSNNVISLNNVTDVVKIQGDILLSSTANAGNISTPIAPNIIAQTNMFGWKFTPTVDISITTLKVAVVHWTSTNTTKQVAIYRNSDSAIMGGGIETLDKLTIVGDYYTKAVTPYTLLNGVEYLVCGLKLPADHYNNGVVNFGSEISLPASVTLTTSTFSKPTVVQASNTAYFTNFDYLTGDISMSSAGGFLTCNTPKLRVENDTNVFWDIESKQNTFTQRELNFKNYQGTTKFSINDSAGVKIRDFLTIGPDLTQYTFPATRGTAGQVLKTDGVGVLTWQTPFIPYQYNYQTVDLSTVVFNAATPTTIVTPGGEETKVTIVEGGEYRATFGTELALQGNIPQQLTAQANKMATTLSGLTYAALTISPNMTLTAGYYKTVGAATITGTLTLSGSATDIFVIYVNGALDMITNASIVLSGVLVKNVFFVVNGAFSVAAPCIFNGNLFASTTIAFPGANTINGKLISLGGAVTFGANTTPPNIKSDTSSLIQFGVLAGYSTYTITGAISHAGAYSAFTGSILTGLGAITGLGVFNGTYSSGIIAPSIRVELWIYVNSVPVSVSHRCIDAPISECHEVHIECNTTAVAGDVVSARIQTMLSNTSTIVHNRVLNLQRVF